MAVVDAEQFPQAFALPCELFDEALLCCAPVCRYSCRVEQGQCVRSKWNDGGRGCRGDLKRIRRFGQIAQIGGPVLMSYYLGVGASHAKLRANIILYFAASTVISVLSYAWSGLFSPQIFKYALFAGPLTASGRSAAPGCSALRAPPYSAIAASR